MEHHELTSLFKKQLSGSITTLEFAQLKQLVVELDEQLVEQCLYEVWELHEAADKRNKMSFEAVRENLKRIIQPDLKKELPESPPHKASIQFGHTIQRVAAIIALPFMLGLGVYYFTKKSTINDFAKSQYSIETANGERTRIVLPDGTRVLVSANSTFTYPATFSKGSREVCISGEAYFDVKHNADMPFIVKSKEINIKVLGTKFNVYAYPDDEFFEVSLVEGKIQASLNHNNSKSFVLKPNEKLRYLYASNTFQKSRTDLQVETAWTRGDLYFQSETLHTILPKIERFYGVKFAINGQLPDLRLTASFHETDVNEILRNLSVHYQFSYDKNGENINLKFK